MKQIEGTLKLTAKGPGFVIKNAAGRGGKDEPVWIGPAFLNTGLNGDTVRVRLKQPPGRGNRQTGEVMAVLKRKRLEFVGILELAPAGFKLAPDDTRMYVQIKISKDKLRHAKAGQKVLVRITRWDNPREEPTGEVLNIIGKPGEHDSEMKAIVYEAGFIPYFPPLVETEAKKIKENAAREAARLPAGRRDFRKTLTFTIDPADAKDFDDAVSFKELADGRLEIGIHIADVAHYVKPETAIDKEAQERTTSIYLVDRTIPMLPEVLSNDLCSLKPNEDKLTFSAVFIFSRKFEIEDEWFGRTVICSSKRFTYEEAQEILTEKKGPYARELGILNRVAEKLRAEKLAGGAIEFAQEEIGFALDEKGRPSKVLRKNRTQATMLIEDLMLLANRKVAEFVSQIIGSKTKSFVYRIHDRPSIEKIKGLAEFVAPLGHRLEIEGGGVSRHSINELLKAVAGTPEEAVVQTVALRTMAKAVYSTKNIGHYGLAFAHYAHFTSPIRRYPDVMVHRLLNYYLRGDRPSQEMLHRYDDLTLHCSQKELEAQEAERASIKYKQVEYLSERTSEVFDGVISGVTKWGIYVQENETRAEGLVRLSEIKNDYYRFDEKSYSLIGERGGQRYRLGDRVRVKLLRADLRERTLDFTLLTTDAGESAFAAS